MNSKKKRSQRRNQGKYNFFSFFALFILLIFILVIVISQITVNLLWFQEVGYLSTFLIQVLTKTFLGLSTLLISGLFLWRNSAVAQKQIKQQRLLINQGNSFEPQSPPLKLNYLLIIIVSFVLLISSTLLYFTTIFITLFE